MHAISVGQFIFIDVKCGSYSNCKAATNAAPSLMTAVPEAVLTLTVGSDYSAAATYCVSAVSVSATLLTAAATDYGIFAIDLLLLLVRHCDAISPPAATKASPQQLIKQHQQ